MSGDVRSQLPALVGDLREAVLLEDDQQCVLLTSAAFCRLFGVAEAPDALIGLEFAAVTNLIAHHFADPSGWLRTANTLRAARQGPRQQPFVHSDGHVVERLATAGMSHYLPKPFRGAELIAAT